MPKLLTFDFGMIGDNFRGLTFIKYLKEQFRDWELFYWIRPEWYPPLKDLLQLCNFIDEIIVKPRSVKNSLQINQYILENNLKGKKISIDDIKGFDVRGLLNNSVFFDKVFPTCEPWSIPKMIENPDMSFDELPYIPDKTNQLELLCNIFDIREDSLGPMLPVFGKRSEIKRYITVGMCRPDKGDWKQPPVSLVNKVWEILLEKDFALVAVDKQQWYPLPKSSRVVDCRDLPFSDKIAIFNNAKVFVGGEGGLGHFAAVCGCPIIIRAAVDKSLVVNTSVLTPYPRKTGFGIHQVFNYEDEMFLSVIENIT